MAVKEKTVRFFLEDISTKCTYTGWNDTRRNVHKDLINIFLKELSLYFTDNYDELEFEIEDNIVRVYNEDILIREYNFHVGTLNCFYEPSNPKILLSESLIAKDIMKYFLTKWKKK